MAVISSEGEDALRRLNGLAAFYARSSSARTDGVRRRLRSGTRASSDERTLQETVIVRCVTVVEAYMTDLAKRVVSERLEVVASGDAALASLTTHLRDARLLGLDQGKWEDLVALWSGGLQVAIKQDFKNYARLVGLRTTRHAIAHRYGEMTEQYRRQHQQRLVKEGFLDPSTAYGPVPLTEADVLEALALALGTVRWLEARITRD